MRKIQKIILLTFIIAFLGVATRSVLITRSELRESEITISQLKNRLNKLREENIKLEKEIYRLK